MMHVFFAPHPSLIPLRSLSYDHPFVFFVRPSLYITLQDPTSFALNLRLLGFSHSLLLCSIRIHGHRASSSIVNILIHVVVLY